MVERRSDDSAYQTRTGHAFLDENGIVRFVCLAGAALDEQAAIDNTDAILAAAGGVRYPLLVDMSKIKSMSGKARRQHAAMNSEYFTAVALLVGTPLSRVIGNFFLGLNRPAYPLELFGDEETALAWLKRSTE